MWFLLLTSTTVNGHDRDKPTNQLLKDAEIQQQTLTDKYGILNSIIWQQRCDDLMHKLSLLEFNRCLLLAADFPNAYSLAHGVVILTEGMLKQLNNMDQLAHILAHEHAHLVLKHHQQAQKLINNPPTFFTKSRIKKFHRNIEEEADSAANDLLLKHGIDPLQIHHYLMRIERINKQNNHKERSGDHQKLKNRIQRNGLPKEVKNDFWLND